MTAYGAVKKYYSAINSRNGNEILKATLLKQMLKAACKLQGCSKTQLLKYAKSDLKEEGLDTYSMLNCGSGKAVATVDDVFRYDIFDGRNYYIVRNGKKYTYIDANAKSIVPGEYEETYQFRDGMAAVKKKGKAGFINSKGETVVPFIFEETRNCYDGKAWVKYNGLWGVIKVK